MGRFEPTFSKVAATAADVKSTQTEQAILIDRLMFIQAIETLRCLNENVVRSIADANIGSIFGWGFAPFQGGTLQFIRSYGIRCL